MAKRKAEEVQGDKVSGSGKRIKTNQDADKAQARQLDLKKASLLELPAELRNQIWRHALLEDSPIAIHSHHNATQPGLLMVNRQIRAETRCIYIEENRFAIFIHDFKFTLPLGHWVWTSPEENLRIRPGGRFSWSNLKEWLRAFFEGRAVSLGTSNYGTEINACLVMEAFEVVEESLAKAGSSWEVIEKTLESMKKVVACSRDPKWVD